MLLDRDDRKGITEKLYIVPIMVCQEQRQAAICEALTWQGTPFEYGQCVKGAGVDCGRAIASWLNASGMHSIDIASLPRLSPQWFMHHSDESFIDQIRKYAVEYCLKNRSQDDLWGGPVKHLPEPADIVVAKCGRDYAHSALVIRWPMVIAAAMEFKVTVWKNIFESPQYAQRKLRFFDPFHEVIGA